MFENPSFIRLFTSGFYLDGDCVSRDEYKTLCRHWMRELSWPISDSALMTAAGKKGLGGRYWSPNRREVKEGGSQKKKGRFRYLF